MASNWSGTLVVFKDGKGQDYVSTAMPIDVMDTLQVQMFQASGQAARLAEAQEGRQRVGLDGRASEARLECLPLVVPLVRRHLFDVPVRPRFLQVRRAPELSADSPPASRCRSRLRDGSRPRGSRRSPGQRGFVGKTTSGGFKVNDPHLNKLHTPESGCNFAEMPATTLYHHRRRTAVIP